MISCIWLTCVMYKRVRVYGQCTYRIYRLVKGHYSLIRETRNMIEHVVLSMTLWATNQSLAKSREPTGYGIVDITTILRPPERIYDARE